MFEEQVFLVEVGEPQDSILSQPTEVAQSASVSLCPWDCRITSNDEDQGGLFMDLCAFCPGMGDACIGKEKEAHSGVVCAHIEPPLGVQGPDLYGLPRA